MKEIMIVDTSPVESTLLDATIIFVLYLYIAFDFLCFMYEALLHNIKFWQLETLLYQLCF